MPFTTIYDIPMCFQLFLTSWIYMDIYGFPFFFGQRPPWISPQGVKALSCRAASPIHPGPWSWHRPSWCCPPRRPRSRRCPSCLGSLGRFLKLGQVREVVKKKWKIDIILKQMMKYESSDEIGFVLWDVRIERGGSSRVYPHLWLL